MSQMAKALWSKKDLNNGNCPKWQKSPRVIKIQIMATVSNGKHLYWQKSSVVEKCTYIKLFRARCRHISSQNALKTP